MQKSLSRPMIFALDLFSLPLVWGPGIVAWGFFAALLRFTWESVYLWLVVAGAPFLLVLGFVPTVLFLRLLLPRLRPGVHRMGVNGGIIGWFAHMMLNRALRVSGLGPLVHANALLRCAYYRAMGARFPFDAKTAIDLNCVDVSLITLGHGVVLGDKVTIACHTFVGDRLLLRPVVIGENSFVGADTILSVGTKIGKNCWIGRGNLLAADKLPDGTRIKDFEWAHGKPKPSVGP